MSSVFLNGNLSSDSVSTVKNFSSKRISLPMQNHQKLFSLPKRFFKKNMNLPIQISTSICWAKLSVHMVTHLREDSLFNTINRS